MYSIDSEREVDIKIRVLTLYDELKRAGKVKNQRDFSEKFGFSAGFFTEMKKGRSGISESALQNITEEFQKYKEWLITGRNSPFVSGEFSFGGMKIHQIVKTSDGQYIVPESLWLDYLERVRSQNECRLCESKDKLVESLEKHIASLEKELSILKKTPAPKDNAECADAG